MTCSPTSFPTTLERGQDTIDGRGRRVLGRIDGEVGVGFVELPVDDVDCLLLDGVFAPTIPLQAGLEIGREIHDEDVLEAPEPLLPGPPVEGTGDDPVLVEFHDPLVHSIVGIPAKLVRITELNGSSPLREPIPQQGGDGRLSCCRWPTDDDDHAAAPRSPVRYA